MIVKNINSNREYSDKHRALMSQSFCDEIIREFTQDGDTVLDPFMGLATTGLSCLKYGRDFVGIEIHDPYFALAKERMDAEASQVNLFNTISLSENYEQTSIWGD